MKIYYHYIVVDPTYEVTVLAFVFDGDGGFAVLLRHSEWPVLHVASNVLIIHLASN